MGLLSLSFTFTLPFILALVLDFFSLRLFADLDTHPFHDARGRWGQGLTVDPPIDGIFILRQQRLVEMIDGLEVVLFGIRESPDGGE